MQVYLDLRDLPGKQLNLNFSNNDVQWNPRDGKLKHATDNTLLLLAVLSPTESQLATAPTNGCVILWDINKRTKSKIGNIIVYMYVQCRI